MRQVTVLLLCLCFLKLLVAVAAEQGMVYSLKLHRFIVCCWLWLYMKGLSFSKNLKLVCYLWHFWFSTIKLFLIICLQAFSQRMLYSFDLFSSVLFSPYHLHNKQCRALGGPFKYLQKYSCLGGEDKLLLYGLTFRLTWLQHLSRAWGTWPSDCRAWQWQRNKRQAWQVFGEVLTSVSSIVACASSVVGGERGESHIPFAFASSIVVME